MEIERVRVLGSSVPGALEGAGPPPCKAAELSAQAFCVCTETCERTIDPAIA